MPRKAKMPVNGEPIPVLLQNPNDPETGAVVRGVPMNQPTEADQDDERQARPKAGSKGGAVKVNVRLDGAYHHAGTFPARPSDDEIREEWPEGGAFRLDEVGKDGKTVVIREYLEVPGFAFLHSRRSGFGWAKPGAPVPNAPPTPPIYQAPAPTPAPAPPAPPPTDWIRIIAAAAPIVQTVITAITAGMRSQVESAIRAALPNTPSAPVALAPPVDPFAQLTSMIGMLRTLDDAGIVRLGAGEPRDSEPPEGIMAIPVMVQQILGSLTAPKAPPPAQIAAPVPQAHAQTSGPDPTAEASARAQLEAYAGANGRTLDELRAFLLQHVLRRADASWSELLDAGKAYVATAQSQAPAQAQGAQP